jgi:hypothetical protein
VQRRLEDPLAPSLLAEAPRHDPRPHRPSSCPPSPGRRPLSNIVGIIQIRFRKDNVTVKFEEIRQVRGLH